MSWTWLQGFHRVCQLLTASWDLFAEASRAQMYAAMADLQRQLDSRAGEVSALQVGLNPALESHDRQVNDVLHDAHLYTSDGAAACDSHRFPGQQTPGMAHHADIPPNIPLTSPCILDGRWRCRASPMGLHCEPAHPPDRPTRKDCLRSSHRPSTAGRPSGCPLALATSHSRPQARDGRRCRSSRCRSTRSSCGRTRAGRAHAGRARACRQAGCCKEGGCCPRGASSFQTLPRDRSAASLRSGGHPAVCLLYLVKPGQLRPKPLALFTAPSDRPPLVRSTCPKCKSISGNLRLLSNSSLLVVRTGQRRVGQRTDHGVLGPGRMCGSAAVQQVAVGAAAPGTFASKSLPLDPLPPPASFGSVESSCRLQGIGELARLHDP